MFVVEVWLLVLGGERSRLIFPFVGIVGEVMGQES